jgi:hypothetical protein
MRRKPLSYADAVKLLGGTSPVLGALGKLAGVVGLTTAAAGGVDVALNLLGLRDEMVSLGQDAVVALRNRVMKLNRFKRSELIEAAHAVLMVSSFFEALDDLDAELRTTLNTASMELTRAEQAQLAAGWHSLSGRAGFADVAVRLISYAMLPGLDDNQHPLRTFYGELAFRVHAFAEGTAAWDSCSETERDRFGKAITQTLPGRAIARYEEQLTRLAAEFPEFAFWAQRVGAKRVLDELRESKREIAALTGLLATQLDKPGKVRSDLATRYQAQVAKPVTAAADNAQPPPLHELYVNPSFRERQVTEAPSINEGSFTPPEEDLWARVLAHLVSTEATGSPLVLLGQPGAGKSAFTEMLAAELDPRDFLVVRVELRAVPADADIQAQIETAVRDLTRRKIGWADLADNAGDAQLVVLLDGFDELLQASGITHYDFLEQVAAFQEREADIGHPVVVLVTSRTAVANQVRYPGGTKVLQLEEFTDAQVLEWLNAWNQYNPTRPLSSEDALAQGDLARQPLLLFLLALFQAAGGELTAGGIGQALLFDRLFTSFVERDVAKIGSGMSDRERQLAIRRDLDDLSMVAFAMFNRGHQSVTDQELAADVTALENSHSHITTQQTPSLTISERLAGRFFFRLFVHIDQATRGQQQTLSSYEFLHASFGEFLVARWIVNELSRLGTQARRAAEDPYAAAPLDDGKLRALLSVTPLSTREHRALDFAGDLLAALPDDDLSWIWSMLTGLLHGCLRQPDAERYPRYCPIKQTAPARYAAYSANLVLLLLALTNSAVPIEDLEPTGTRLQGDGFYSMTGLWNGQLGPSEFGSLLSTVELRRGEENRVEICLRGEAAPMISGRGALLLAPDPLLADTDRLTLGGPVDYAAHEAMLLGNESYAGAYETLLPYLARLGEPESYGTGALLLTLVFTEPSADPGNRLASYQRLLAEGNVHVTRFALGRMRDDAPYLSPGGVLVLTVLAAGYPWTNITAYLDLLARTYALARSGRLSGTRISPADVRFLRQFEDLDLPVMRSPDALVYELEHRTDGTAMDGMLSRCGRRDQLILLDPGNRLDAASANELEDLLYTSPPGMSSLLNIIGLRDLVGAHDPRDLLQLLQTSASAAMLDLALWTSYVERGLPSRDRPARLPAIVTDAMQQFVPEFVAKTSRLASEHGYSDPFKLDP